MNKIGEYYTLQCSVDVYHFDFRFNDEEVYAIVTKHYKTGKVNTRFANKTQLKSILNSYRNLKCMEFIL